MTDVELLKHDIIPFSYNFKKGASAVIGGKAGSAVVP